MNVRGAPHTSLWFALICRIGNKMWGEPFWYCWPGQSSLAVSGSSRFPVWRVLVWPVCSCSGLIWFVVRVPFRFRAGFVLAGSVCGFRFGFVISWYIGIHLYIRAQHKRRFVHVLGRFVFRFVFVLVSFWLLHLILRLVLPCRSVYLFCCKMLNVVLVRPYYTYIYDHIRNCMYTFI